MPALRLEFAQAAQSQVTMRLELSSVIGQWHPTLAVALPVYARCTCTIESEKSLGALQIIHFDKRPSFLLLKGVAPFFRDRSGLADLFSLSSAEANTAGFCGINRVEVFVRPVHLRVCKRQSFISTIQIGPSPVRAVNRGRTSSGF